MKNVEIFYQTTSSIEEHFIIELPYMIEKELLDTIGNHNPIYNNILIARLFGLSYCDFLLYLKEDFKVTLVNNNDFIYPVFTKKQYRKFLEMLNGRWGKIYQKNKFNRRKI